MTITEFLTARYDEDEAVARAASSDDQWWVDGPADLTGKWWVYDTGAKFDRHEIASHVARFDPTRTLADIAAKRAIVALHHTFETPEHLARIGLSREGRDPSCSSIDYQEISSDCETLRTLAQPYAEHPDFDPAWRV